MLVQDHQGFDSMLGLSQLLAHCATFYPDPSSVVRIETGKRFVYHGGSDPLDIICIFKNAGDDLRKIPKHWHYVSFGLSDIHNYNMICKFLKTLKETKESAELFKQLPELNGQLFPPQDEIPSEEKISGFGFELTFRLRCDIFDEPPQWPINVLQSIARNVFRTFNVLGSGDHCTWHRPLSESESNIKHLLSTEDPQLSQFDTALGRVRFIQIVGVNEDELSLARKWSTNKVLKMMKRHPETGGELLVTDMSRTCTLIELHPEYIKTIESAISLEGSFMVQIYRPHKYSSSRPKWLKNSGESLIRSLILNRLKTHSAPVESEMQPEGKLEKLERVYLLFDLELAEILPVIIEGRLAKGRRFFISSPDGSLFTILIPEGSEQESNASKNEPFVRWSHGGSLYLQILVSKELQKKMSEDILDDLRDVSALKFPKNYSWPDHGLFLTIVERIID